MLIPYYNIHLCLVLAVDRQSTPNVIINIIIILLL